MTPQQLFLTVCIPTRVVIALLPLVLSTPHLKLMAWPLLAIGLAFQYLFWTGSRMRAFEAGGVTWWHSWRIVHGSLYLAAAWLAFMGSSKAWIPLMLDVCVGVYAHVLHYYSKN